MFAKRVKTRVFLLAILFVKRFYFVSLAQHQEIFSVAHQSKCFDKLLITNVIGEQGTMQNSMFDFWHRYFK